MGVNVGGETFDFRGNRRLIFVFVYSFVAIEDGIIKLTKMNVFAYMAYLLIMSPPPSGGDI